MVFTWLYIFSFDIIGVTICREGSVEGTRNWLTKLSFNIVILYVITLSNKAIVELRTALRKSYGADFDVSVSDDEINNIGVLVLTGLVESLKLEMVSKLS